MLCFNQSRKTPCIICLFTSCVLNIRNYITEILEKQTLLVAYQSTELKNLGTEFLVPNF